MNVAILLAAYNSGAYIGELIDSILTQTHSDFTLYIRDDCSRDNTMDVVRAYTDPRICIVPNDTASGSAQNNFFALFTACGADYIMFCDADDVWLPEKIEKTLRRMLELEQAHGKQCPMLVHTDLSVVDERLHVIADSMFRYEKLSPRRKDLRHLLVQNNITGCTMMVNAAARRLVPRQPAHSVMHDWWLALVCAAFGEIAVIDQPLILYRQHGDNQVGAYDASDLALAAKKLSKRKHIREVYSSMYRQAGCFADTFRDTLPPRQLALCRAYAAMQNCGKLKKIHLIVQYRFYKNTLLRNIGQFLAV